MTKHALAVKEVLTRFFLCRGLNGYVLDVDEWQTLGRLKELLHPFYMATVSLSGTYTPTTNEALGCIFAIGLVLKKYEHDPQLSNFINSARNKIKQYWGDVPMLYLVGFVMDPAQKMDQTKIVYRTFLESIGCLEDEVYFEFKLSQLEVIMQSMYNDYKVAPTRTHDELYSNLGPSRSPAGKASRFFQTAVSRLGSRQRTREVNQLYEYYSYSSDVPRDEDGEILRSFDALKWWKNNEARWPALASVARDVLAVPMSTVASESAFSSAGRIVNDYRCRLKPATTEICVCLQDWIRAKMRIQDQTARQWLGQSDEDIPIEEILDDVEPAGEADGNDE